VKNGLIINTGNNQTKEEKDNLRRANTKKYSLPRSDIDAVELQVVDIEDIVAEGKGKRRRLKERKVLAPGEGEKLKARLQVLRDRLVVLEKELKDRGVPLVEPKRPMKRKRMVYGIEEAAFEINENCFEEYDDEEEEEDEEDVIEDEVEEEVEEELVEEEVEEEEEDDDEVVEILEEEVDVEGEEESGFSSEEMPSATNNTVRNGGRVEVVDKAKEAKADALNGGEEEETCGFYFASQQAADGSALISSSKRSAIVADDDEEDGEEDDDSDFEEEPSRKKRRLVPSASANGRYHPAHDSQQHHHLLAWWCGDDS
jgi:hypothetical protein